MSDYKLTDSGPRSELYIIPVPVTAAIRLQKPPRHVVLLINNHLTQAVESTDMFLGMSGKNESSTSCEDMVLRVELPGISGASGKQITCCRAILQSSCDGLWWICVSGI